MYTYEKAAAGDSVRQIARCLHMTDSYIYPLICQDPEDPAWLDLIGQCMKDPGNLYHIDHMYVAKRDGQVAGVACIVPCGEPLHILEGICVPASLQAGMQTVTEGYFRPLIRECAQLTGHNLINFCIDTHHRRAGVGTKLLQYCVGQLSGQIHLDVVAHNDAAVRLYKKHGFSVTASYGGFSGNELPLPCYHMIRK